MKLILIVEDNDLLGKMIAKHFSAAGFEILWARSSQETTEALNARDDFALILLDIMLPDENGFVILKRLKKNPQFKHIPVIVLSNLSEMENMNRAKQLGALDYIIKSNIEMPDLITKVKQVIGS